MAAVLLSAFEATELAARKKPRGLGLTATIHEGQVYLSWDPQAKPIPAAEVAVLSITDAGRHEAIMLNLDALRMAKLAYRPIGTDVTFDLTVNDPERGTSVTQSVRVIIRGTPAEPDWTIRPVSPAEPPVPV